jgi:hypothetical protein
VKTRIVSLPWRIELVVNARPRSVRQRVGRWLRLLAQRIDGRPSLALSVVTEPHVSDRVVRRCVQFGLDHAAALLKSEVLELNTDHAMRLAHPELFRDRRPTP